VVDVVTKLAHQERVGSGKASITIQALLEDLSKNTVLKSTPFKKNLLKDVMNSV
jgi:hypothetical protein